MIMSIKTYESLTDEDRLKLVYTNPCTIKHIITEKPSIRVGEIFDEDLGWWRPIDKNDF